MKNKWIWVIVGISTVFFATLIFAIVAVTALVTGKSEFSATTGVGLVEVKGLIIEHFKELCRTVYEVVG